MALFHFFYGWIIFHHMLVPHHLWAFLCWWTFRSSNSFSEKNFVKEKKFAEKKSVICKFISVSIYDKPRNQVLPDSISSLMLLLSFDLADIVFSWDFSESLALSVQSEQSVDWKKRRGGLYLPNLPLSLLLRNQFQLKLMS